MGRLAQVFSVGVRGSVEIVLPKREFYAGEFVLGHVALSVKETVDAEAFVLTLLGKEHLSWRIQQGKNSHNHHIRREVIRQQIPLVVQATIFQPGDYVFPFQFQLPPGVPSSFAMYKPRASHITRVKASVLYKLKADVRVKGMLTADMSGEYAIGVHALPMPPQQAPRPLEDSLSRQVYFMCCFNKGTCHVLGTSSTNAVDLINGVLQVRGAIRNETTCAIDGVYVRLYQDFVVHIPDGYSHSGLQASASRLLHQVPCGGLAPAASKDDISFEVSVEQIVTNIRNQGKETTWFDDDVNLEYLQPFAQLPVFPTTDMTFVSIRYHVEIHCSILWCSDVKLEFPLLVFLPPFLVATVPTLEAKGQ